nr:tRNA preQ1(34) S-adenosylmethionine ribosyltransferase-isomerase QueA [Desulfohalovibrio reitneri]
MDEHSGAGPTHPDLLLSSYGFELPEEQIAQHPPRERGASRIMVLDRRSGETSEAAFADLPDLLPPGALLVANDSAVVPARVAGTRPTGGRVELLLLTPPPLLQPGETADGSRTAEAEGLLKASKRIPEGEVLTFPEGLTAEVLRRGDFGRHALRLTWRGDLGEVLSRAGAVPLPPYIRRAPEDMDRERYQTVYADAARAGSVAAPTAGLHFTPDLRERLVEAGFGWTSVTLYVGYGTFSPIRVEDLREHHMHAEWIEVGPETAEAVARAKAEGRPVVAVGTTSARVLEGMHQALGHVGAFRGETDIFMRPGYEFKVVDGLLTNFHLPFSSLILLVSAFAGRRRILETYARAVRSGFRFFSYGDAMLIR